MDKTFKIDLSKQTLDISVSKKRRQIFGNIQKGFKSCLKASIMIPFYVL